MRASLAVLRRVFGRPEGDAVDLLFEFGNPAQALLASELFTPRTIELDGSVVLASSLIDESGHERWANAVRRSTDRAAIEQSFNLLEIPYCFADRVALDDDGDEVLAECVAAAWRAWLPYVYPGRRFLVEVVSAAESGSVVAVTFSEDRNAGRVPAPEG